MAREKVACRHTKSWADSLIAPLTCQNRPNLPAASRILDTLHRDVLIWWLPHQAEAVVTVDASNHSYETYRCPKAQSATDLGKTIPVP